MEERLQIILREYIKNVENICESLLKSINCSENTNLQTKQDFFVYRAMGDKMEFQTGELTYKLHGKGCMAFNESFFLDWDFGYRSRWCGIDPWKVSMTLQRNNSEDTEYYDGNLIKTKCDQLVEQGIMFKQYDQYYFELLEEETFRPEFPKEYDTLVIEQFNSKWSIPRNKVIDRFIRKSTRVYKHIDSKVNKYLLKFLLKEV